MLCYGNAQPFTLLSACLFQVVTSSATMPQQRTSALTRDDASRHSTLWRSTCTADSTVVVESHADSTIAENPCIPSTGNWFLRAFHPAFWRQQPPSPQRAQSNYSCSFRYQQVYIPRMRLEYPV